MSIYEKNLKALKNPILKEALSKVKAPFHFKILTGSDPLDINLQDLRDNSLLYQNPMQELNQMIKLYNESYPLYPVLYFYGFGNGLLYKFLAQNEHHLLFVIFESEIEIIYHIFHLVDFSKEFEKSKILFLNPKDDVNLDAQALFTEFKPAFYSSRVYFLELHSSYYEKFKDNVKHTNEIFSHTIENTINSYGNDAYDSLLGIKHHSLNLAKMISHPTTQELKAKRKGQFKSCVIVSTGPSLAKQLPLLKEFQDKVVIFAADSAYPILIQNDIIPDYVCMVERTDFTAEFFKHDFGTKDDKTTFLLASLVSPKAIEYLERRNKNYSLIEKFLPFYVFTALKRFGYLNEAVSVAHMSLSIASFLDFQNIVFIGQDLAYGEDGSSHSKDYQNGEHFESEGYEDIFEIEGYGGTRVKTHFVWHMFKHFLEKQLSILDKKYHFYNATEGGARIKGTIEKPFKECCEEFFTEEKGVLEKLENLNEKKQKEFLLKALYKLYQARQNCLEFRKNLEENLDELNSRVKPYLDKIDLSAFARGGGMQDSIEQIMQIREKIEKVGLDMAELLQPLKFQFDLNLGRLVSIVARDDAQNLQKNLWWIKEHLYYFELIAKHIKEEENVLESAILNLENVMKEKGLKKRIEKLKNKFEDEKC
ncbi:motility associated factor glycosyltransferase family protein [Campylobacter helveticus]|uniref:motility associated factor glycosyltransferase family protein n=1 Tax=Campylobacter helveticus TaxID=28898 RepID=UPI0011173385|nr:motility associated factor glycosyltransferase family protein [Campylobacter helveticus]TNH36917.1 motility associated factor glycosyltransferase family protein [Campylobacter helveticus]